ncbi:hypothetical protein SAMN05421736_12916 [Evansella caseinilytica]|uniref:Uncharacterized protein n=1 Tax=Evansella caseinilytica TaxID=1503961 RepID=A0A1H3UXJ5_9BACI|nr:hypothetical protein [Evansella caseinilytica]SDZ67154.1 hypothetical protein SAMN05421736_12916 [Evansella caseinilytica]
MGLVAIIAAVTQPSPAFHNPGHIRLWNESPLRNFDPHLVTILLLFIIVFGIGYWVHFKRKEMKNEGLIDDKDEKHFQELAAKKNILLNKILQAEEDLEAGKMTQEEFAEKTSAYKKYLQQVKKELNKYLE